MQMEDEYNKKLAELEKKNQTIIEIETAKEKKRLENIQQSKEEAFKIQKELKENFFNESKQNIACNLEVYLEIIRNKVHGFIQETQILQAIKEDMKKSNEIYQEIEKEIEDYNLKKAEVVNKIYSFYDIDYNANIEYLSKCFNNLAEVLFKNNKKLSCEEIEEFILNNQLNLSSENQKKVMQIKQNYEKMVLRFKEKLEKFKKQKEESEKLIKKFSNNEKINNILELNNKYEGALNKFVQSHPPQEQNTNLSINNKINNNPSTNPANTGTFNFNFNRDKFNLKNNENKTINNKQPENRLANYDENAHSKIFEEIMKEFEIEFESLKNQYDGIKNEIETIHRINHQAPNNVLTDIPINAEFNLNKSIYSESAIKNFYRNYKENSVYCSQDPFSNINLYNDLKNNLGKVLQNHIPRIEYIDDSGDDFDEIFNNDKKPDNATKVDYDLKANSAEFRESKKCEFANIFSTKDLNDVYQKYKEQCNQEKIIETAQIRAKKEFEANNKNLSDFAKEIKNRENKENSFANIISKNLNFSKNGSSKNINSSFISSSESDYNSSMLSVKNIINNKDNNIKQIIPPLKNDETSKQFGKSSLIPEKPKAENPNKRESSVESSKEKKYLQPKEPPFSFKQREEPKEDKTNKSLYSLCQQATSLFTSATEKNKPEAKNENEKNNLFQSANALIPKLKETEIKADAKVPAASSNLFSGISTDESLFSGFASLQHKQEEKKESKEGKAATTENKKDVFSSLIPSSNNNNENQEEKENTENKQAEAPKNLFVNLSGVSNSSTTGLNPLNIAAQAAKQKTEVENKKDALYQDDKNAPPVENANSTTKIFNQNLSFSQQARESQENKPLADKNLNPNDLYDNNSTQNNQTGLFSNLAAKADAVPLSNIANNLASANLNQESKKEENKTSTLTFQNKNNPPDVNFNNLFKPAATNQSSGFPGFGIPQQRQEANKPAASIFPNLQNQALNIQQNSGFAGLGQNSSLNPNQQQQFSNPFGGNSVSNADSNTIPKFGFGQSSSLSAPIAAKVKINLLYFKS
jgi:hypothetical protein